MKSNRFNQLWNKEYQSWRKQNSKEILTSIKSSIIPELIKSLLAIKIIIIPMSVLAICLAEAFIMSCLSEAWVEDFNLWKSLMSLFVSSQLYSPYTAVACVIAIIPSIIIVRNNIAGIIARVPIISQWMASEFDLDEIIINCIEPCNEHKKRIRDAVLIAGIEKSPQLKKDYVDYFQSNKEIKYLVIDIKRLKEGNSFGKKLLNLVKFTKIAIIFSIDKEIRVYRILNDQFDKLVWPWSDKDIDSIIRESIKCNLPKNMHETFKELGICKKITQQEDDKITQQEDPPFPFERFFQLDQFLISHVLSYCLPAEEIAQNLKSYPVPQVNLNQASRAI